MIRPHMLACLVCWLAGLSPMVLHGDDWKSRHEAGNLSIFAEFPLRDVQGLVDELAALQGEIEATLRLKANDQPIEIYLFASRGSYVNHVSVRVPNAVNRRALYVQGKDAGRIYAYRHREMDIDVRHEATHAILHNCLPFVPLWLDEGLAEYFEVRQAERKSQNPHHSSTKWVRRFGGRPDLVALEKKRNLSEFDGGIIETRGLLCTSCSTGHPQPARYSKNTLRPSVKGAYPSLSVRHFQISLAIGAACMHSISVDCP